MIGKHLLESKWASKILASPRLTKVWKARGGGNLKTAGKEITKKVRMTPTGETQIMRYPKTSYDKAEMMAQGFTDVRRKAQNKYQDVRGWNNPPGHLSMSIFKKKGEPQTYEEFKDIAFRKIDDVAKKHSIARANSTKKRVESLKATLAIRKRAPNIAKGKLIKDVPGEVVGNKKPFRF